METDGRTDRRTDRYNYANRRSLELCIHACLIILRSIQNTHTHHTHTHHTHTHTTHTHTTLTHTGWTTTVVVQPALGYHITNNQSRYITPTRLKTAQYSLHNNAPSSRKLLKMDVITSETCWAVDNKASVIKLVNLYSNIKMMHDPIRIRVIDCTYTNLDNIAYYTPSPHIDYRS